MSGSISISSMGCAPALFGALPPVNPALPWLMLALDPVDSRNLYARFGLSWTAAGIASVGFQPDAWFSTSPDDVDDFDPIMDPAVTTATTFALFGIVGVRFTLTRIASGPRPYPGT